MPSATLSVPAATIRPSRNVAIARTPSIVEPGSAGTTWPRVPNVLSSEPDERSLTITNWPAAAPPASTRLPETTLTALPTASVPVAFSVTVPRRPKRVSGVARACLRGGGGERQRGEGDEQDPGHGAAPTRGARKSCDGVYDVRSSEPAISAAISATSVGVRPTRTPLASSASALAFAVPAVPETIAPAWPIVLPGGAVKPAM